MLAAILRQFFDSLFKAIDDYFKYRRREKEIFDSGAEAAKNNSIKNDVEALRNAEKNSELFNSASDDELDKLLRDAEPAKRTDKP